MRIQTVKKITRIFLYIFLFSTLYSCEQIKSKGIEFIDTVFPQFDTYKEDTKYNKKRFEEYLEVEVSSDIKKIYCFCDFIGVDYKVLFSFTCDTITIKKIIDKKGMKLTTQDNDNGLYFSNKFDWWNEKRIKELKPFKYGKEYEFWQYLWYDNENKKAYYLEFSL